MEEISEEIKTLMHHILHKHKFYRLEMSSYAQILTLLNQQITLDPVTVQQRVFQGILEHNKTYKDNIAHYLNQSRFDNISSEMKSLIHKILHQFHFLYSIKAYELFQFHFQQPCIGNTGDSKKQMFDDQVEKYKLHSMYYGPFSIYNMGGLSQPLAFPGNMQNMPGLSGMQGMPGMPSLANMNNIPNLGNIPGMSLPNNLSNIANSSNFTGLLPPNSLFSNPMDFANRNYNDFSKQALLKAGLKKANKTIEIGSEKQMQDVPHRGRGRPAKNKKILMQKIFMKRIPHKFRQSLSYKFSKNVILQQKNDDYQYCNCRGYLNQKQLQAEKSRILQCKSCKLNLHQICMEGTNQCASCQLRSHDPFNKVVETLGAFYIDFEANSFEEIMNMKIYQNICKTGRFEVMVSCTIIGQPQICWPDDTVFKINNQIIFQVPALMTNHPQKRRKDGNYFITQYIFQKPTQQFNSLERVKFSLQAYSCSQEGDRRNNRSYNFLIGFYLIQKIAVDDLYKQILCDNKSLPTLRPLDWIAEDEVQIDRLSVTYFDPFSGALIDEPVRGAQCLHLQCFDLLTFLTFTWHSPDRQWKCPFCSKDARSLIVDKFQLRILEQINDMQRPPKKVIYFKEKPIQFYGMVEEDTQQNQSDQDE